MKQLNQVKNYEEIQSKWDFGQVPIGEVMKMSGVCQPEKVRGKL